MGRLRSTIFSLVTTLGWFTNWIPKRIRNASETVNYKSLEGQEHNSDHEQDELPGLSQYAKRDNQRCRSSRWVRRFEQDHQSGGESQGKRGGDHTRPRHAD